MQLEKTFDMKKVLLRVLLVICGLNVFTACYGMPPGDWPEPGPYPDEETKDSVQFSETSIPEESSEIDTADPALPGETDNTNIEVVE